VSLRRVVIGFTIGLVVGVVLGGIAGLSRWGDALVDPPVQMLRTLPFLGLIPLFILWFGIGETPKIALVALGVAFPLYVNVHAGIRDTDAGPLMADLMAASQADPDIRAALDEQWLRPRRQIGASLLQAGIERGELDAGTDIAAAVDQIFAPVYYRLLLGHEPLHDSLAATLVRQVLDGLRPRLQPDEGPGSPAPAGGHSAGI